MVYQSTESSLPWWRKLINFFLKWNPLTMFFKQLRKLKMFESFVQWIRNKLSPKVWVLTRDAMAKGAMAAVGGIGSSLVNQFIETKDGKWNRALDGSQPNLPTQGVFGNGSSVPVNKPVAYGYGSQPSPGSSYGSPSESYPFAKTV